MRNFNVMPAQHTNSQVLDGVYTGTGGPTHLLTVHPRGASLDPLHAVDAPGSKKDYKVALARSPRATHRRAGRP